MTPAESAKRLVTAARVWYRARQNARRISDSKSARKSDIEKSKKDVLRAAQRLEKAVEAFEKAMGPALHAMAPGKKGKAASRPAVPWGKVFAGVEVFAGAVTRAIEGPGKPGPSSGGAQFVDVEVLD